MSENSKYTTAWLNVSIKFLSVTHSENPLKVDGIFCNLRAFDHDIFIDRIKIWGAAKNRVFGYVLNIRQKFSSQKG